MNFVYLPDSTAAFSVIFGTLVTLGQCARQWVAQHAWHTWRPAWREGTAARDLTFHTCSILKIGKISSSVKSWTRPNNKTVPVLAKVAILFFIFFQALMKTSAKIPFVPISSSAGRLLATAQEGEGGGGCGRPPHTSQKKSWWRHCESPHYTVVA